MAKTPNYVSTLNDIANGERVGHDLFTKWSAKTQDPHLKPILDKIAIREAEHSWAFEKRLNELGHTLTPTSNKALGKLKRIVASNVSDEEKFKAFGIGLPSPRGSAPQPDRLLGLLADTSIDPRTGELLGRFICEERDSGRLLRNAYRAMQRRKTGPRTGKKAA